MAIIRKENWIGGQRVDTAHLRSIESAVAGDFDLLAGTILSGKNSYVISGFTIAVSGVGGASSALQLTTATGALMHPLASESGTIFSVPADRNVEILNSVSNPKVQGNFTSSAVNYIGIDLRRTNDDSTSDIVAFVDVDTGEEFLEEVPLARTLDYKIVISTTPFSATPALCPIAKVITDSGNSVLSIQDARPMYFRLGSGGSSPDIQNQYLWPAGRDENITGNIFSGGDKTLSFLKDWQDAVMTRLWEVGGGKYWYSNTADRNVQLMRSAMTGPFPDGDYFEVDAITGNLHWQGLSLMFENSGTDEAGMSVFQNIIQDQTTDVVGLTDILPGECIYVDLDRTDNATIIAVKANIATLGSPTVPGSRFVIAYDSVDGEIFARGAQFPIGSSFAQATTASLGIVGLSHAEAGVAPHPFVYSTGAANVANGVVALGANITAAFTSTTGTALTATSGAGNGRGLVGVGNGSGSGVRGQGGASGNGVEGLGVAAGIGVQGTGGTSDGTGGSFTGGTTNGTGVIGIGTGTGYGVKGTGGNGASSGHGGHFDGGTGPAGIGLYARAGTGSAQVGASLNGDGGGAGVSATGGTTGPGATLSGGGNAAGAKGAVITAGGANAGGTNQRIAIESVGNISFTGTAPAGTVAFTNTITPNNIIKACGSIQLSAGVITGVTNTFNISSGSPPVFVGDDIVVTLANNMANATYIVQLSKTHAINGAGVPVTLDYSIDTVNDFYIIAVNANSGVVIPLSGGSVTGSINFTVLGAQ